MEVWIHQKAKMFIGTVLLLVALGCGLVDTQVIKFNVHTGMGSDCYSKYSKIYPYPAARGKSLSECQTMCSNNPECGAILMWKASVESGGSTSCYMVKPNNLFNEGTCTWGRGSYNAYEKKITDTCVPMCSSAEGCSLVKNTLMTTLTKLAKEFFISFEYKATAYGRSYQSVIHFTEDGDCCDVGQRIPGVWAHDGGRLHLTFSIDGKGNYYIDTEKKYPVQQWHQAEFSQRLENGKYIYQVKINGKNVIEVENKEPRLFSNVKVYASDPWYSSLQGSIRNLYINKEAPNKCGGSVNVASCSSMQPCRTKIAFGTSDTSTIMTKGIFAIWWDNKFDHSKETDRMLDQLMKIRTDCLTNLGMADPPNPAQGFYYNVYINHDDEDLFPKGTHQGTDKFGKPYMSLHYLSIEQPTLYHEGFHIFQYESNSPGFEYHRDSQWYTEATANWYKAKNFPNDDYVHSDVATIIANPHLALWHSVSNGSPEDPVASDGKLGWLYVIRQYGMSALFIFLTEVKGIKSNYITDGFYAHTNQLPQEYLFNKIGPTTMRSYFADWAAHNTAGLDYLSAAQTKVAMLAVGRDATWEEWHAIVWNGTSKGTDGQWVRPPMDFTARGWAYNVFRVDNPSKETYKFKIDGDAKGSDEAPSHFEGRVIVKSSSGFRFSNIKMSSPIVGEVDVAIESGDSEAFLVVVAVPKFFTGNQKYGYKVNISPRTDCPYTDTYPNFCPRFKYPYCTTGIYVDWMATNCAKTCKC